MNHPNLAYRKGSDTCKLMSFVIRPETSTIQPWRTRTLSSFSAPNVSKGPISSAWVHTTPGPLARCAPVQQLVTRKKRQSQRLALQMLSKHKGVKRLPRPHHVNTIFTGRCSCYPMSPKSRSKRSQNWQMQTKRKCERGQKTVQKYPN